MSKRVIIIHGWDGYPDEGWFPWLKANLKESGFEVTIPSMPNASEPKIDIWVPFLSKIVGKPDKNTLLVGHSIGCQTILRYLEGLEKGKSIGGMVLVAGFLDLKNLSPEEMETIKPWLVKKINLRKVKSHVPNITAVFSDNDTWVSLKNEEIFKKELDAKTVILQNKGHFSGSDDVTEIPVVLEEILKFSKDK